MLLPSVLLVPDTHDLIMTHPPRKTPHLQFAKSTCLISVRLHGAVPSRCNCTGQDETGAMAAPLRDGRDKRSRRRRLTGRVSHGVKHHGGSFKPSATQRDQIRNLTRRDAELYERAVSKFWIDVKATEGKYGVRFC